MNKYYIIPPIIILSGSIYYYLEHYKGENLIGIFGFSIILGGWYSFYLVRHVKRIKDRKKGIVKKSVKFSMTTGLIRLILIVSGLLNAFLVADFAEERKSNLWEKNEKMYTYARIIKIEKRKDRYQTKRYLIFEYSTKNKIISKEKREENESIKVGDSIAIIYVKEHPELWKIKLNSL